MGVERTPPPGEKPKEVIPTTHGQVFTPVNLTQTSNFPQINLLNSVSSVATTSVTTTYTTSTACTSVTSSYVTIPSSIVTPISSTIGKATKNGKRDRKSPIKNARKEKRQRTIDTYWLKSQSNRFEILSSSSDDEEESENVTHSKNDKPDIQTRNDSNSNNSKNNNNTEPKPPPIYIQKVETIAPLKSELTKIAQNMFEFKILNNGEVKVQLQNSAHYHETIKMLKSKNTEYYTYKPKSERGFKVILRNMHYSADLDEIKQELSLMNHKVMNIYNILQRGSKRPTSLFSIELETSPNNKEIYSVQFLSNCKISFEPPHHKRTIPQCSNCQKYGHTKNFCNLNAVCVKCAGKHKTIDCPKNNNENSPKCALCSGNHTANYKGCEIYKNLKIQRFSKVQNKKQNVENPNIQNVTKPIPIPSVQINSKEQTDSYASVAAKTTNNNTHNIQNNDFSELKQMMKEMMSQISSMLNVILSLIQKLDAK